MHTCSLSSLFLGSINEQHPYPASAEAYGFLGVEGVKRGSSQLNLAEKQ